MHEIEIRHGAKAMSIALISQYTNQGYWYRSGFDCLVEKQYAPSALLPTTLTVVDRTYQHPTCFASKQTEKDVIE